MYIMYKKRFKFDEYIPLEAEESGVSMPMTLARGRECDVRGGSIRLCLPPPLTGRVAMATDAPLSTTLRTMSFPVSNPCHTHSPSGHVSTPTYQRLLYILCCIACLNILFRLNILLFYTL